MSTSIERAISVVLESNKPLTIHTLVPAYYQVAGFTSSLDASVDDAMLAFEHALDKHPLPSSVNRRQFVPEVDQLRREYWKEVAGRLRCDCGKCPAAILPHILETVGIDADIVEVKTPMARKRKTKKRKAVRRSVSSVSSNDDNDCFDPFAPSTSANML